MKMLVLQPRRVARWEGVTTPARKEDTDA
jgi:hypothetical protein